MCLLVGQFLVIWIRVLPYLRDTYGPQSTFYLSFLWGGFPVGLFALDFMMFLGPFGLLPIVPMPENLRQFVPAYAATRMIAEVLIEALPQCIMQAIILVMVSNHVRDGTANQVEKNLMAVNGGTFTSTLPKSILISSLTMLKTWYELVQEAREAGIGVGKKGVQLWNVGYGLPLDAIKSGSITGWKCQYEISDLEVVSLVDALGKNDSLERLDLSLAGFEWMPPVQREERNALSTLLTVMNGDSAALESLETLIICETTKWEVPVGALRSGPESALKTLGRTPLLSKGGPERKEVHAMHELLCKNRNPEPSSQEIEVSVAAVTKVFNDSRKEKVKQKDDAKKFAAQAKAKRDAWRVSAAQLITKGMVRRAHFTLLVSAEVLRNVGFAAQELLDLSFSPEELKAGFFEARELKQAGFKAAALKDLGYKPKDLWEAQIPVTEMKGLGYNARDLKDGGYTAQQMKDARCFTLVELKAGRYKAVEVVEAGYHLPELRAAKFTALDLRKAQSSLFTVQMIREAGYTAPEMKSAGYDAQRVRDAGYDAIEATDAGYTVTQMHSAGYSATELRKAGFTALVLREDGYDLNALQGAGYSGEELQQAGYTAQELKEAGTSLVQLKAAGTPVATLKDSGYTAERLKQQGYTAAELAFGARGRVDIKSGVVGGDEGGYTAKELKVGGITAVELRKGRVFFCIDEFRAYTTRELRDAGFTAGELRICGYSAADLNKVGFTTQDLVTGGFDAKALRSVGAPAGELRVAGLSAKQLSDVGYSAKELLVGGFTAKDLIACGFGVGELCEAGFDAIQLRQLGFSAKELKAYGYGAGALKEAGSTVKELKELGFPDDELDLAGFTKRQVEAVDGRSVRLLKDHGKYEVAELRECGFIVADLRGIYTVKSMKDDGFSLQEIQDGGIPFHAVQAVNGRSTRQLRMANYTAKILKKVGFDLADIVDGGFTASELKEASYNADELKDLGFTAGSLRVAGFTSKQLQAAQYKLLDMQKGGFDWRDLVIFLKASYTELTEAGYANLDPKHRLFLEYRYIEELDMDKIIHDLSVLSPRYRDHRQPGYPDENDPSSVHVGETPLVMRHGYEMTSDKIGDVPAGTAVKVMETRKGDGLKVRVRLRYLSKGWFSQGFKEGWVTSVQDDGTELLIAPKLVAPVRLPPPSFQLNPALGDLEV